MRCAKYSGELERRESGGVTVNPCPRCQGVWFDKSELSAVLNGIEGANLGQGRPAEGPSTDAQPGRCPRCDVALERFDSLAVEGLAFDRCAECEGVWLDRGELQVLAADPAAGAIGAFFADPG